MIVFSPEYYIQNTCVIFFDLDGTLVETNYANFLAYKSSIETVTKEKCTITYNPNERFTRTTLIKEFSYLTDKEILEIIAMKEFDYHHFLPETKLNDEVFNILKTYYKTNECILVTNCHKKRAESILEFYSLTNYFAQTIFYNSNLYANKYIEAIAFLEIRPELIVVYEDNEQEIRNARELGIIAINPILHKLN